MTSPRIVLMLLTVPLVLGITNCEEQVLPPDHVPGLDEPVEEVEPNEPAEAHADPHCDPDKEHLAASEPILGASVYQLDISLTDQDGETAALADFQGEPVVAALIYTTCTTACPMILNEVESIVDAVDEDGKPAKIKVLLISMDPERDTPEALKAYRDFHQLDERYVLARADEAQVREIAAVLGTRYRQLPSGDYNHSPVIALLDAQGQLTGRMEGFGQQRGELVERLRDLVE